MMRIAALALIFAEAFSGPAAAKDPTDADWMIRMMVCTQQNSPNMEIYLPQSIVFGKKPLAEALAQRSPSAIATERWPPEQQRWSIEATAAAQD